MKILKVISLVVVLHMALLAMLVFQPGCQSVTKTETAKAATPVGDTRYSDLWVINNNNAASKQNKAAKIVKENVAPVKTDRVNTSVAYSETAENHSFIDIQEARVETASVYADNNEHGEYAVEQGDSLWKIARKNNISMRTLMTYNGLRETDRIFPGQVLLTPGGNSVVASNVADKKEPETKPLIQKKSTTLAEVPASKEAFKTASATVETKGIYKVKPGDSLYIIAMQNNTTVESIRAMNNLDKNLIRIGQEIMIPGQYEGAVESPLSSDKKSFSVAFNDVQVKDNGNPSGEYLEHEVKAGEFPGLIARKYNMNVADLLHLNDIQNPRMLRVGTTLKVINPEFMMNQTVVPSASKSNHNESVTVKVEGSKPKMEEETSVSTINFEDFPIVRVGS
jgi:LysM repeat protein